MATIDNIHRSASDLQGGDKYPGIDTYESLRLEVGSIICALIAYRPTGVMKPCEFYFPPTALKDIGNDAKKLCQGLQICPWGDPSSHQYSYKNRVSYFRVIKAFNVEYSPHVSENQCYGEGGITQYYIPNEKAKDHLVRLDEERLLDNYIVDEDEYELIIEKKEQILIKRNLFSYLKAKTNTFDIIQNTTDADAEKEAKKNLETINRHIENLMADLAYSQEGIGDVISEKYDHMIRTLMDEIEIREQGNSLLISNVKLEKESASLEEELQRVVAFNLIAPLNSTTEERIEENLTKKMEKYESFIEEGASPSIDVTKQNLRDLISIHKINIQRQLWIHTHHPKEIDYNKISQIVMHTPNGERITYPLQEFFISSSVEELKTTRNGMLSPPLIHKKTGALFKLRMVGNKPQLFIGQRKDQLREAIEKLQLSPHQQHKIHQGEAISIRGHSYRLDPDLNVLIPDFHTTIKQEVQIKSRSPKIYH